MKQGLSRLFRKRPNGRPWSAKEEFDERWKRRISTMATFIAAPGPVADLGCGMMWLEQFLPARNSYLPIDYIRRDERTTVVDFNKEAFPEIDAQVIFMSGALEYVDEAINFLHVLAERKFEQIILSYCTKEKFPDMKIRRGLNWTSHLSIYNILTALTPAYDLSRCIETEAWDTIFVFNRKHEGLHS